MLFFSSEMSVALFLTGYLFVKIVQVAQKRKSSGTGLILPHLSEVYEQETAENTNVFALGYGPCFSHETGFLWNVVGAVFFLIIFLRQIG